MRESQSSRTRTLLRLAIISTPRFDDTLVEMHISRREIEKR